MQYCLAQKNDAMALALIHKTEINQGFLSSLPTAFLEKLYEAIILSPESFCVVAKEGNEVVGFISGATHVKKLYRYFLRYYLFYALAVVARKMFNISALKKIMETFLYPSKEESLPSAELLTMAVSQKFQGQGIASSMFAEFLIHMRQKNIHQFKVLVGSQLVSAIKFYEKQGFVFVKNTSVHGRDVSKIYVYTL